MSGCILCGGTGGSHPAIINTISTPSGTVCMKCVYSVVQQAAEVTA